MPADPNEPDFYARLPILGDFNQITRTERYVEIPDSWCIVLADVQGSTKAIESGRYKDVNVVGASTLIACLNALKGREVPYVFGGDGATLIVPAPDAERLKPVLRGTRVMAQRAFALGLRVGIVPVAQAREQGHPVRIAKIRLSERFTQAAFIGGGLAWAEKQIKDPEAGKSYRIDGEGKLDDANFSGLECRWNAVPSKHGEMVSLLVAAVSPFESERTQTYTAALQAIQKIYGAGNQIVTPLGKESMSLGLSERNLRAELSVKTAGKNFWARFKHLQWLRFETLLGAILMRCGLKFLNVDFRRYKDDLISNSDFQKFDEMLRMVLSGTAAQRQTLVAWLEEQRQKNRLAYGLHTASEALVTCLIFDRNGGHIHFVDGAEGGYAKAASGLKAQLRTGN